MRRSDFIEMGAGGVAAVVLLLAAARKAGERTQEDRDDDLAAAHASTETSGHGGTKGSNDLSYAIFTWVNFYDVAGIESRIESTASTEKASRSLSRGRRHGWRRCTWLTS